LDTAHCLSIPEVPCAHATIGNEVEPLNDLGVNGQRIAAVAGTGLPKLSSETYMNLLRDVPGGMLYVVTFVLVSSFKIWPAFAPVKLAGVA